MTEMPTVVPKSDKDMHAEALHSKTVVVKRSKKKTRRGKRGGLRRKMQHQERLFLESLVEEQIRDIRQNTEDVVYGFGEDVCYHERREETYNCQFGCCGSTKEKECCDPMSMIIGISIGCVLLVAAIIAIIVCCIKQQTRNKRRLQPRANNNIMLVSQAKGPPAYPGLPYQPYPEGYKGPMVQPPPMYQTNPGYAPPSYVPPEQRILYSGEGNQENPKVVQPGESSPPPPYTPSA